MKKTIFTIAIGLLSGLTATAQINGDGYYRIKNVVTGRYMSLSDNSSRGVSMSSTTVDASALLTKKNLTEVLSDPGTIFYIQKVNSDEYNISAQGANLYNMINYYIRLKYYPSSNIYRAWQSDKGQTMYLADENDFCNGADLGYVDVETKTTMNWNIIPVDTEDNYIGVNPTIKANGKYYAPYYVDYAFSPVSKDMKVYYINKIDENSGTAYYKELTGTIPASTPVILECASNDASQNKLKIESANASKPADNKMTGTYFCVGTRLTAHYNSTKFDATSMRVLGTSADGSLELNNEDTYMADALIRQGSTYYTYSTIKAIPQNSGYLKVSASCPKELKLVDYTLGVSQIEMDDEAPAAIYSLNGTRVKEKATSVEGLPKGIYIFKNKKYVVK